MKQFKQFFIIRKSFFETNIYAISEDDVPFIWLDLKWNPVTSSITPIRIFLGHTVIPFFNFLNRLFGFDK
jgi:hypothetical protein